MSYQTRLLPVEVPPSLAATAPPRVSASAQNGARIGTEPPVSVTGANGESAEPSVMPPLVLT
jgi:hypothetical protein